MQAALRCITCAPKYPKRHDLLTVKIRFGMSPIGCAISLRQRLISRICLLPTTSDIMPYKTSMIERVKS